MTKESYISTRNCRFDLILFVRPSEPTNPPCITEAQWVGRMEVLRRLGGCQNLNVWMFRRRCRHLGRGGNLIYFWQSSVMSHNVSPDIKINFVFALTSAQQRPGLQPTTSHFVATFSLHQMLPTPVSTNNTSVCQQQDDITLMVTASTCLDDCITRDGSNVLAEENVNKYEKW